MKVQMVYIVVGDSIDPYDGSNSWVYAACKSLQTAQEYVNHCQQKEGGWDWHIKKMRLEDQQKQKELNK